jgi:hypothetical protein
MALTFIGREEGRKSEHKSQEEEIRERLGKEKGEASMTPAVRVLQHTA